ncbi:hypothetical protein K493DRAFT_320812 [Basidiobolus meristosporus CBS 931.73]|uniref:Extracellular membrane protein CFEM domain-containing protein n=1 Tax=Basidiobolus meristosporus CBS 931.73 TaxID=1314790 RepID=A0A1Y1X528_9FUNG|nr:hypothetical protein K493DRAFT_320812 [Basidiobolus meristosporus CBS 931.73]|eukprot:ORX80802.1 hypothetical protein K493DRAFT_320812 [Basidiobolus meristosporus CBS 931.73]
MMFQNLLKAVFVSGLALYCAADDVNSTCEVVGFKVDFNEVMECCLKHSGGSNSLEDRLICTLPTLREGFFRRCVKRLGYATTVECEY